MSYKIEEIEGIGPAYGEKLTAAGIKTTDDLLTNCGSESGRKKTATSTGLSEGQRVLPPVCFIEVHSQEVAGVVGEQGIASDDVIAGKVLEQDGVGQGGQFSMATVSALDSRLLADPRPPFVGAGR